MLNLHMKFWCYLNAKNIFAKQSDFLCTFLRYGPLLTFESNTFINILIPRKTIRQLCLISFRQR